MLIAPISFCTVVLGIAGAGNMKKVWRVGGKALISFEVVSTFALVIGLIVANLIRPGAGFNADPATLDAKAVADYAKVAQGQSTIEFILHIIQRTFFDAFTGSGDLMQVLFVVVHFGYAMTTIRLAIRFDMYMLAESGSLLAQAYVARARSLGAATGSEDARGFARAVSHAKAAGRRFTPMRSLAAFATGLQLGASGQPERAIERFEESARVAEALGARLWAADARFEAALAWLDRKDRASGGAALDDALRVYRECGARPAEQRVEAARNALMS